MPGAGLSQAFPRARGSRALGSEKISPCADLVHRLERGDDDHVERHAEEQRADREEDEDRDRAAA